MVGLWKDPKGKDIFSKTTDKSVDGVTVDKIMSLQKQIMALKEEIKEREVSFSVI